MANRLALELVADANGLLKTMEQAQRQLNSFIKSSESAGQTLGSGVNRALDNFMGLAKGGAAAAGILAGGVLAAAGAATALVESAGRQAEMLEQTSQKTGIAVTTLQSWTVAMAQSGLGMDSLTRGVKTLSDQIVQSRNPNSQAAEKFAELGLTATSVDGVLEQLADRFDMMPDGADKTRIAVELFGKAGQDLIPILNRGSAGFRESMEQSKALGAVLSTETVKALSAADDAFDTLGVATKAASNQLAGLMAPAVTAVTESLTKGIGVVATFFGTLNEGSKGGENTIQFLKTLNPLIQKLGGPGFNVEAMEKQAKDMAAFGEATKQLHDEMIAKLEEEGRIEEAKGYRLRSEHITAYREITAEMKAQEQLGRNVNAIEEAASKVRNAAFARELQQQEEVNNLQFSPATLSDGMKAHEAAVENLIRLMPGLNHQEAALQVLFNQEQAAKIIRDTQAALKDRNKELELGVEYAKADFTLQQAWYQRAPGLIGQADLARVQGIKLLEEENALRRQVIDQTIFDEERKGAAIFALDKELQAKRIGIINQFPTFWEQQLGSMVSSSAFSLSSITSNFNNATAQWIQGQGNFTEFFKSTQTMMLNVGLQTIERWLAEVALAGLREIGLQQALDAAKVALGITTEAQKTAAAQTGAAARMAIAEQEAVTEQTLIGQTGVAITSMWKAIGDSTIDLGNFALSVLGEITKGVLGIIDAIADALTWTGILAPVGIALKVISQGLSIASGNFAGSLSGFLNGVDFGFIDNIKEFFGFSSMVDLDSIPSVAFATGGIATGPTFAWMAEAGSPEAAIPLNDRGAAFMQKTMGLNGGGVIIIRNELNGRVLTEEVLKNMPGVYRLHRGNR